jgi:hypothetical protein
VSNDNKQVLPLTFDDARTSEPTVISALTSDTHLALVISRNGVDLDVCIPRELMPQLRQEINTAANIVKPKTEPARKVRSKDDLRVMMSHLTYERDMLVRLHNMVVSIRVSDMAPIEVRRLKWSMLEAFLIHARNLRAFLYGETDPALKPNDALATDFFINATEVWTDSSGGGRPQESAVLGVGERGLVWLMGKHLAHLSWERTAVGPEPVAWQVAQFAQELEASLNRFDELLKIHNPSAQTHGDHVPRAPSCQDFDSVASHTP